MHQQRNLAKVNAALQTAYEQAIYEVYYGQETIKIYIGEYCRPLDYLIAKCDYAPRSLTNRPTWALITAANPYSKPLSELENQQRQQKLIEYLQELPWSWLDAVGKDRTGVWTPEPSLLILGIDRFEAIAIGQKFEQNALVYGELNQPAELQWL
ncbi:hypothetical protein C7B62_06760 [Pleurocapsa sp. CCALA 161]|uniref:DUF3293 domain-containing protein n=1 Tax=Pleurocapsa sp. CCALA 161 TaxID=2107688 RepID=UPI000D061F2E|nr:DUF3293 domain-containing protein [Pleurocapsa sp. CCALA 161]PSB11125.1 hypothetical protein C7B62_06760 [Pleurocapsa sp. CCALA 161]